MDPETKKGYEDLNTSPRPNTIDKHEEIRSKITESAYKTTQHYLHQVSPKSKEQAIEIFYKDSNSFSVNNGALNFHGKKVFVFVHGGYWQYGSVLDSAFMAENFVKKDIVVISVGYDLAPDVTLFEIINQVHNAVDEILKYSNGSDVYILGHSAGGHLVSTIIHAKRLEGKLKDLRGIFLISGVYDVRPVVECWPNYNLKLTLDEAAKCSPILSDVVSFSDDEKKNIVVTVNYAEHDTREFRGQSKNYAAYLKDKLGLNVTCQQIPGVDHFEIIENTSQDSDILTKEIYSKMGVN